MVGLKLKLYKITGRCYCVYWLFKRSKVLGYPPLKDTRCGIKLVFINDSVKSKSKKIMVVICLEMLLIFGNVESAGAKDNWGVEGFKGPISKLSQSSRGYFDSRPARGASE